MAEIKIDFSQVEELVNIERNKPTQKERLEILETTLKLIQDFLSKLGFIKGGQN